MFDAVRKRQLSILQEEHAQAQNTALQAQIVARQTAEKWTDAIVSINRQITELADVDSILLNIVENARELLQADFVGLAIMTEAPSILELKCFSKKNTTEIVRSSVIIQTPLILEAFLTAHTYRSSGDEPAYELENIMYGTDIPAGSVGIVRLEMDNRPIGILWSARSAELLYSEMDLIWMESMADQVVITIQHGLMTSQLQSLSITEERARIAREMHDGLAQVLGYLNLEVQTLNALQKQGKSEALTTELEKMRDAINTANADIRENILSLRTTLANNKGLILSIDEYLEEFSIQTGIDTTFEADEKESEINLSSIAEVQLVCILQEALANVRKHARANQVSVSIKRIAQTDGEYILLLIQDNGVGFVEQDSKRSFGLQTMKERAYSAQGMLDIHSILGKGTTIECRFPSIEVEQLKNGKATYAHPSNIYYPSLENSS